MSLPDPIARKLAMLIHGLAGASDSETLAIVEAMRRHLAAAGRDLHDLAALVQPLAAAPLHRQPVELAMGCLRHGGLWSRQKGEFLTDVCRFGWQWNDLSERESARLLALHGRKAGPA